MRFWLLIVVSFLFIWGFGVMETSAQIEFDQNIENELMPDPKAAFWRSLVLPGWGHRYVDKNNWGRGQWHMASDVVLLLGYIGLRVRANKLEDKTFTFARTFSGTDLEGRDRSFVLAVSQFDNLQQHNDFRARARQWERLLPETPEFQWQWESTAKRQEFRDLRDREDRLENQLPALIGLMIVNRVVSGISASNRAKKKLENLPEFGVTKPNLAPNAFQATIRFGF